MTDNYHDNRNSMLEDYEESRATLKTPENITTSNSVNIDDDFDINVTELLPATSVVNIFTLPSSDTPLQSLENSDEIPFDTNEWLITDPSTGKGRHPRQDEFLRLLMENPRYSLYASWLDKSQGLFKINQPNEVAALWKKVKSRQTTGDMDYDTFARGVRYHYQTGSMIKTNKKYTFRFKYFTDDTEQ